MKLGKAIQKVRKNHFKGNQVDFANAIGITQSYLSGIENNKKEPSTSVLQKISDVCEIPIAILFWFSIDKSDVAESKQQAFDFLKPSVDAMLKEIFEPKETESEIITKLQNEALDKCVAEVLKNK
jgi:transcriptional regulator with XRE-family HTH domain